MNLEDFTFEKLKGVCESLSKLLNNILSHEGLRLEYVEIKASMLSTLFSSRNLRIDVAAKLSFEERA